ncbi:GTPase-associated protein 1-related protein [Streptomyces sp. NBC_01803]|uniref:GTPase-associated protein 1-related protein n=1 Tax=Streptomyces sp. NBC_01803 TaxID=2975946 RepID=UPI002DD8B3E1|nr:GTPase-associated protein 1-related protein [Streptomyces sp. NBC_01803]WSA43218.1 GTPase-associated protein 1-related protein [Streptomyces sp. NBC_01803]
MSLTQLHYTSAPPGPDGSGFRFTAVTPGAPQSLLREAEQLIGYEPPRDAAPRPTAAELDSFPEAFSHSLLSDGSRLLARTVYTGADYSGRWGNFHAHAVHLPAGTALPGGALPITAWGSPRWAASTPDGGVPEPLDSLAAPGRLDRDGLIGFAASRASWLADFFADLRRLSEDESAPQLVVVERDSAAVARWIALASTVLPRENAHRLTFTTYTRRPQLARQQILGVLPEDGRDLAAHDHRYRVHDCTGRASSTRTADAWARIAARVWLGRAPELFKAAAALPDGHFAPGPLAVEALCAGLELNADGRTAAADWAQHHADTLGGNRLHRLVNALGAPTGNRTAAETAALTRLFAALDGRLPVSTIAPLAALVLTVAVRSPGAGTEAGTGLAVLRRVTLTEDLRRRLAAELGPDLRAGVADTGNRSSRSAELLCVADTLGVDCADLLPDVAHRLSVALLADPDSARTPAVRFALEDRFDLRAALLAELDFLAQGDPPAAARLLARVPLPFTESQALPHLRMCAEAPRVAAARGDRVTVLNAVLRAGRVSPIAEPTMLRTAVRLVWDGDPPTAREARLMLGETGSSAHLAAGTWSDLVKAALQGPADDPDVPDLAHDLLHAISDDLEPRERRALQLLEFARELRDGSAAPKGWIDRALTLRAVAEPVEPAVLERAYGALARRLLSEERPDGELRALILSGDADLIAAYGRAAQSKRVGDRLRVVPAYVADCFAVWSSHPQASVAWQETRSHLLDRVLRPIVRALPDADLSAVERQLERAGARWAEEFQAFSRPGAFGRFGRRLTGRGRKDTAAGPRWGDVEPPRKGGRP